MSIRIFQSKQGKLSRRRAAQLIAQCMAFVCRRENERRFILRTRLTGYWSQRGEEVRTAFVRRAIRPRRERLKNLETERIASKNRAAKSAPYIPVANDDCLASPPCKRGSADIPHGVGFDTEGAPQAFIHSVLDPIAAFCRNVVV